MAIIIVDHSLAKVDIKKAREEHDTYIKITIDIEQEIIAIGGEYHIDAENILVEKYKSKRSNIWGGGYKIGSEEIIISAISNIKPNFDNNSMEILDKPTRDKFLKLAKKVSQNIKSNL